MHDQCRHRICHLRDVIALSFCDQRGLVGVLPFQCILFALVAHARCAPEWKRSPPTSVRTASSLAPPLRTTSARRTVCTMRQARECARRPRTHSALQPRDGCREIALQPHGIMPPNHNRNKQKKNKKGHGVIQFKADLYREQRPPARNERRHPVQSSAQPVIRSYTILMHMKSYIRNG